MPSLGNEPMTSVSNATVLNRSAFKDIEESFAHLLTWYIWIFEQTWINLSEMHSRGVHTDRNAATQADINNFQWELRICNKGSGDIIDTGDVTVMQMQPLC